MSCAKHIEANVAQKFGKQCARYVCAIAKTFSTRHSSRLFDEIRKMKPEAVKYLEDITNGCPLAEHSVVLLGVENKYATKVWNCNVKHQ